ncbi:GAF domain-containing protein [Streptomyces physcomitrii]|uniref:GAF domain-containing protein n=1 Tax=Streptomyces physcomitrii TaxID=2724184 RepID=A0ABX1H114_9ACTN|nr:GAF domain-containing protein [Streptomyces physcomitrii]NKI42062.1 GAF domain-containing protein [Streptomyces physcomitrii]
MTGSPTGRLLLTPEDGQGAERAERLRALGLLERAEPDFDRFAEHLAVAHSAPWAMVNFLDAERQFLAGLHWPSARAGAAASLDVFAQRSLGRDHGYCPHVVVRRRALALEDVRDYPRFAQNPVVDGFGVRSYLGAPLLDRSGLALGTVCVLDVAPRRWGGQGLAVIKAMAAELTERILSRDHGI